MARKYSELVAEQDQRDPHGTEIMQATLGEVENLHRAGTLLPGNVDFNFTIDLHPRNGAGWRIKLMHWQSGQGVLLRYLPSGFGRGDHAAVQVRRIILTEDGAWVETRNDEDVYCSVTAYQYLQAVDALIGNYRMITG